jgi:hypothetical protein
MANSSSSNVVKEGDEVYKRRVRILCAKGARLVLYCMPAGRVFLGQKKKFHGTGEVEPKSRRRDDDAGPLRETRGTRKEKRQNRNEQRRRGYRAGFGLCGQMGNKYQWQ